MRDEVRPHRELAELAGRQHGVIAHQQLLDLGYSRAAVGRATASGRIHRIHRGAYAVGHKKLTRQGRAMAAVLACGRKAMISHQSAAWLLGMRPSLPPVIHVTTPWRGHVRGAIKIHHSSILEHTDRQVVDDIPATAVPRTLLDLASGPSQRELDNAVDKAERLNLLDLAEIDALLARSGTHRGRDRLRRALDIYRDPVFSRARSERLLLDLVKKAGLPRPAINTFVEGHEIDAYWPKERFAVEVDGWTAHRSRRAFELDPLRQENLRLAGIDVIRITARRIEKEPEQVAASVARLLALRRSQGLDVGSLH